MQVFSTSATNKDVRQTFKRAQSRASAQRPWTSCRVGCDVLDNTYCIHYAITFTFLLISADFEKHSMQSRPFPTCESSYNAPMYNYVYMMMNLALEVCINFYLLKNCKKKFRIFEENFGLLLKKHEFKHTYILYFYVLLRTYMA